MSDKRIPLFLIEQYVLGELPPHKAEEVERSDGFAERVAAIEAENASFLERYPPEVFAKRIENQYEATRKTPQTRPARSRGVRLLSFAVPGAAALLALSLVLFGGLGLDPGGEIGPDAEIVRLKGSDPAISVYRSAPGSSNPEELSDEDIAEAGDRLQITYNAAGRPFGAIVSVDGRGAVTLHYPLTASDSPELSVSGEHHLPYAYVLDDAPLFERFYFFTSDALFDVESLLAEMRDQADVIVARPDREIHLTSNLDVATFTILKGE